MAKVLVHVWHNPTGQIIAVGRPMGEGKCIPISSDNQSVLESQIDEEHVAQLHQTHIVDIHQKALVAHSGVTPN